jgi:hypothetical protein
MHSGEGLCCDLRFQYHEVLEIVTIISEEVTASHLHLNPEDGSSKFL